MFSVWKTAVSYIFFNFSHLKKSTAILQFVDMEYALRSSKAEKWILRIRVRARVCLCVCAFLCIHRESKEV